MGTFAQYVISITLFIAIPVGMQWAVSRLAARRASELDAADAAPIAQPVRD
jgi:hypothetical protein